MRQYLRRLDDPAQFMNYADYPDGYPGDIPQGFELVTGELPVDAIPYRQKSLGDKLNDIFKTQSAEIRGAFGTLKAAVKIALDEGDLEAAEYMITNVDVPEALESIRTQMLTLLQEV